MNPRSLSRMPAIVALITAMLALFTFESTAEELTLPLEPLEAKATTYYVSVTGAGTQDGSSEANALPYSRMQPFIRDQKASAKIIMLPGEYITPDAMILVSPTVNDVLVIEGRSGAVIRGDFTFTGEGSADSGLRLHSGNIIVRGLDFKNVGFCVKANKSSVVSQVLIENIRAFDVHSCILVDRDSQQPVTRWIVRNSQIKGYYRAGLRLAGSKSRDFLVDHLDIDGNNTASKSECFKSGIQIFNTINNITIRNTSIANNVGTCGEEDYQQGDGIEMDHKDGTPNNIRLENVRISNSGDAEMDLKADNVKMYNVTIEGGDFSRYAFKVWGYKTYECTNCFVYGMRKAYVNLNKASMAFHTSVFANGWPLHPCDLRHGKTPEEQSVVTFDRSQMYLSNEEWASECGNDALANVKRLTAGKIAPPAAVTNLRAE